MLIQSSAFPASSFKELNFKHIFTSHYCPPKSAHKFTLAPQTRTLEYACISGRLKMLPQIRYGNYNSVEQVNMLNQSLTLLARPKKLERLYLKHLA